MYGVAGSRRFWTIRTFDGPSGVIRVGCCAGRSFQKEQGVMFAGIPAVSGCAVRSAATARPYAATSRGQDTSLQMAPRTAAASVSGSGPETAGGSTGRAAGSRVASRSRARGAKSLP